MKFNFNNFAGVPHSNCEVTRKIHYYKNLSQLKKVTEHVNFYCLIAFTRHPSENYGRLQRPPQKAYSIRFAIFVTFY